jgi:alkylhydroperoxidase family enzyme
MLGRIGERHGYVSNLMQTLALVPDGLAAFAALDAYTTGGSELTERQRQIVFVVAVREVHYGWTHHAPLALAAGVTEAQLLLIHDGRIPKDLDPADKAVCEYGFEIAAGRRIPPRVAEEMHAHFSPRQIVDAALVTVQAMSVAALAIALEVSVEPPETLEFALRWHRERS